MRISDTRFIMTFSLICARRNLKKWVCSAQDVVGALTSVLVSIVVVLPSLMPLLLLPQNTALAIRISNIISVFVIFGTGYGWGVHTDTNPWKTGLLLASVCLTMVLVAVLLGGK